MAFGLLWLAALCILQTLSQHDDHGAHYEWAGIFATPEDTYMWTAQKVNGAYADPKMKIVVLPADHLDAHGLEELETPGATAIESTSCVQVQAGGVLTPQVNTCYQLVFKEDWWQTLFTIDTSAVPGIAVFAEHVPTEFENTAHYLKDDHGDDIEPQAELPDEHDEHDDEKPWGGVLAASFLVNLVTLVGVILSIPVVKRATAAYAHEFNGLVSGFTAGALMACAFFLLLFEATHLVAVGWTKEVDVLWRWGALILAGFLVPAVIDNVCSTFAGKVEATEVNLEAQASSKPAADGLVPAAIVAGKAEATEVNVEAQASPKPAVDQLVLDHSRRVRIIGGVLVGDFFHNLCDGVFIAAAFQGCGSSFGWSVALGTVLHEFPQEFGDFAILTGDGVSLPTWQALVSNFCSGLSVMFGALITLATEEDQATTGLLLAFGGGVYIHIAATECMPRIYNSKLSRKVRLACVGAFMLGAFLIGLVLLGHEHCEVEGAANPHAGHHH